MNEEKQARLTVFGLNEATKKQRKEIAKWLYKIAKEMETLESESYTKNPRWTLYKSQNKNHG